MMNAMALSRAFVSRLASQYEAKRLLLTVIGMQTLKRQKL